MFSLERDNDTICAIATASGLGAISVIRLSGKDAESIIRNVAAFLPSRLHSHRVYYGFLNDHIEDFQIDEVLVTFFETNRSFTGETTFEISCHGGLVITQEVLQCLIRAGARLAQKGEFTYRAFKNGRIDLAQAESVLMMIESQNKHSARMALRQLRGELSEKYASIQEDIIWCLSRLEANIDFSSEDIEIEPNTVILAKLAAIEKSLSDLIDSYQIGRIAKEGFRIALVGPPNVGKSSLLNRLVHEDRAIVSDIAGTTRDTIEITIEVNGKKVELIDTAGLHEAQDPIEKLGIKRTMIAISNADLIFYIHDSTLSEQRVPAEILNIARDRVVEIYSKSDLANGRSSFGDSICYSSVTGEGLSALTKLISNKINVDDQDGQPQVLVARQYQLLRETLFFIQRGLTLLAANESPEFCISELNEGLNKCMEISGKRFDDEILDRVFSDFCLGK